MEAEQKPKNIQNTQQLRESGLQPGDRVHLGVCGPGSKTDDGVYLGEYIEENGIVLPGGTHASFPMGIKVRLSDKEIKLLWGDIIELWPLPMVPPPPT